LYFPGAHPANNRKRVETAESCDEEGGRWCEKDGEGEEAHNSWEKKGKYDERV
jgi:hypothetical protein